MKQYKLKKDLPTFKAGGTFHINDKGNLVSDNESSKGIVAYSKSTLDKFPCILTDWFEEYEEQDPLSKESLIEYLRANPEQRLMQAVYNFIEQKLGQDITSLAVWFQDGSGPADTERWECDHMMLGAAGSKAEEPEFTTFEDIEKRKKLNQMKSQLKEWAEKNDVTKAVVFFSSGLVRFRSSKDWDTVIEIKDWPRDSLWVGKSYDIDYLLDTIKTDKE